MSKRNDSKVGQLASDEKDDSKIVRWYTRPEFNVDEIESVDDLDDIDFISLLGQGEFQTEDGTWYECYPEMAVEKIKDKKFLKTLEEWDGEEGTDAPSSD